MSEDLKNRRLPESVQEDSRDGEDMAILPPPRCRVKKEGDGEAKPQFVSLVEANPKEADESDADYNARIRRVLDAQTADIFPAESVSQKQETVFLENDCKPTFCLQDDMTERNEVKNVYGKEITTLSAAVFIAKSVVIIACVFASGLLGFLVGNGLMFAGSAIGFVFGGQYILKNMKEIEVRKPAPKREVLRSYRGVDMGIPNKAGRTAWEFLHLLKEEEPVKEGLVVENKSASRGGYVRQPLGRSRGVKPKAKPQVPTLDMNKK